MTATLTQKDSIGLLRDAYKNKYLNLLSKMGIDLIGLYISKDNATFIKDLPALLSGSSMSKYSNIFRFNPVHFGSNLNKSIYKVEKINNIISLRDILVIDELLYNNTPIKAASFMEFPNQFFASALNNSIKNENEIINNDIEKAIRLFRISKSIGGDYIDLIGIKKYEARMLCPGDFLAHQAIFLEEEDAVNFLVKCILKFQPNFIYRDFYYSPDWDVEVSGAKRKCSGEKRSELEIIEAFNNIPSIDIDTGHFTAKEFQAIIKEFPLN